MELGLRVVRGPDWKWNLQDGGVGHVGTVVEIGHRNSSTIPFKTVVVQWDSGSRSNYRVGYQGAYDLRVLDNAPAGAYHPRVKCDECGSAGIIGMRWQCSTCIEFDLCTPCYMKGAHDLNHPFIRIDTIYHLGLEMPKRSINNTVKIQARGIFKGARVVRGYDWEWDQQDGGDGKIGEVIDIRDWDSASGRSVASVKWQRSSNVYRVGHKGKVDLKCVVDAAGGYYYRDHLPILGRNFFVSDPPESLIGAAATARPQITSSQQRQQQQSSSSSSSSSSAGAMARCPFNIGDKVKVVVNSVDDLKSLQKDHGGWNPRMAQFINKVGIVHRITDKRDIRVQFDKCRMRWTFNPVALEKYSCFAVGDLVTVIDDEDAVKKLQQYHGEYVPDMAYILGSNGRVVKVYTDGDLRVTFEGKTWTLNPLCCVNLSEMQKDGQVKDKKPDVYTLRDWLDELGMVVENTREIYAASKQSLEGADPANTSTSSNVNNTDSNDSILNSSNQLNASSNMDFKCLICDENFANVRFFPCSHQVCCTDCRDCVNRMKKCISCRQVIKKLLYIESSNGKIYGIADHEGLFSNSSSNISFDPLPSSSTTSLLNNFQAKSLPIKPNGVLNIDPIERLQYLETKIMEIEEANTCGICLESTKNVIFLCGHGTCAKCSSTLSTCHMCRQTITKRINIY